MEVKRLDKENIYRKVELQIDYLNKKINGHGGGYCINDETGRVTTDYVGTKNALQIFLINIRLWIIWKWK